MTSPFFDRFSRFNAFADSRDGDLARLSASVAERLRNRRVDAGQQSMPPIGNIIDESRLEPYRAQITDATTPEEARHIPQSVFNAAVYGDMIQLAIPLASGQEVLALPRPKNTRVFLLIQNTNLANLYVAFDQVATTSGLLIPPSGSAFFDSVVPQNDVHIIYGAAAATVVPIFFINADISRAVAR